MSTPPRDILNPISENTGSPLDICGTRSWSGIFLKDRTLPVIEWENIDAENSDGDGTVVISSTPRNPVITAELRVVEPELDAATNLVVNPSFEKNLTSWAAAGGALSAGATFTQESVDGGAALGEKVARVVSNGANRGIGINATLVNGTQYTVTIIARKVAGALATLTMARAATDFGSKPLTDEFQEFEFTTTATASGAAFISARVNAAGTYEIAGMSVATAPGYFDGDTPGCTWSGTAHASTAARPASGGPRFWAMIADLQKTVQRIKRRGGTYRHTPSNGTAVTFDLVDARIAGLPEDRSTAHFRCEPTLEFECRPFGRLTPFSLPPVTGANLQKIDIPDVPGSADALGSLKITEPNTAERYFGFWGLRHRFLDAQPLEYVTGDFTLLGAAVSYGMAAATLLSQWMPLFELTGLHVGTYRVWAISSQTSDAEVCLEWGLDDARRMTRNPVVSGIAPALSPISLGEIIVPEGSTGWKAQVLARGAGAFCGINRIWLQPIAECAGKAESRGISPTTKILRGDAFPGAGELNAAGMSYSPPGARTWVVTPGRFSRATGKLESLSAAAGAVFVEASAVAGVPEATFAGVSVSAGVYCDAAGAFATMGVYARRAGGDYLRAAIVRSGNDVILSTHFTKTGATAQRTLKGAASLMGQANRLRVELGVTATGLAIGIVWDSASGQIMGAAALSDADLATGGSNATGSVGIFDSRFAIGAQTRTYYDFLIQEQVAASTDILVTKNGGARVTHKAFDRLNNAGNRVGGYEIEGDYLRIPPSGREKSASELSVLIGRTIPESAVPHNTADQVTATLTITPRVLLTA